MVLYAPRDVEAPTREPRLRAPRTPEKPDIGLIRDDLYVVLASNDTMGYVARDGNVYVALAGRDLEHTVTVGQSLSWDQAVQMVQHRYLWRG